MSERISPPIWYWIGAVLALIWNAMGVVAYLTQVYLTPEAFAEMTTEQQTMYQNTPAWATAAYAFAVFGGLLGCFLLLFRKHLAYVLLLISLLGVSVQWSYYLFIAKYDGLLEGSQLVMTIMIPSVAALLVLLAKSAKAKGWIS